MTPIEELFSLAENLNRAAAVCEANAISKPLNALKLAAEQIDRSFSGSWYGYHANTYYENFQPPPPGARFSQEWGLMSMSSAFLGSQGTWIEYDTESIKQHILSAAGNPVLDVAKDSAEEAARKFEDAKASIASIFTNYLDETADTFIQGLSDELGKISPVSSTEVAEQSAPKGKFMTRDTIVIGQGMKIPLHIDQLSQVRSIQYTFEICGEAGKIATKAASHMERRGARKKEQARIGTNVFIGHGRSIVWRDLKDFLQDRMNLPWDEFNRVPVAGLTNITRLSEMLDAAAIAFLIMTAEDEAADGSKRARMNVIHEAGLFQGRLGFAKAIVLLEEGCEQFSNIDGLGQIRFPTGNISAVFEQIREVLEREGIVQRHDTI